jgi:hypothetical protein
MLSLVSSRSLELLLDDALGFLSEEIFAQPLGQPLG